FIVLFASVPATTDIYTLSLHDALPISVRAAPPRSAASLRGGARAAAAARQPVGPIQALSDSRLSSRSRIGDRCPRHGGGGTGHQDRKSTRLNSSHVKISYAVFCLKKKK